MMSYPCPLLPPWALRREHWRCGGSLHANMVWGRWHQLPTTLPERVPGTGPTPGCHKGTPAIGQGCQQTCLTRPHPALGCCPTNLWGPQISSCSHPKPSQEPQVGCRSRLEGARCHYKGDGERDLCVGLVTRQLDPGTPRKPSRSLDISLPHSPRRKWEGLNPDNKLRPKMIESTELSRKK